MDQQLAVEVAAIRATIDRLEADMDALQAECPKCGRRPMQADDWPRPADRTPGETPAEADFLAACVAFAIRWQRDHVCGAEDAR